MRTHYTYEIATSSGDGRWKVIATRAHGFRRPPESIARCLLETWIYERRGDLPGGARVMVFGDLTRIEPAMAYVRVRVYRGFLVHRESRPVAVAYLGDPAERRVHSPRTGRKRRWRWGWDSRHLANRADPYDGCEVA